ncbi:universal stress protein [Hymenobacter humi]|uniref:Universal stress protein n=1 Tax=Hymenobacter humi TaxID=1411620 RepID=A0ABW2UDX8_9BACT
MMAVPAIQYNRSQAMTELLARTQRLDVPAQAEMSTETLGLSIEDIVQRYHPVLLASGREEPHNVLDRFLTNLALPVLQDARYPLLVVPEGWKDQGLPERIAVAADGHSFWLTAPSLALAGLMEALRPTATTVVHVAAAHGPSQANVGLESVVRTGLFGALDGNHLYELREEGTAEGIVHAARELNAQLLVVMARPHTFLGGLFHRSITAQIMRHSPIPVLVLPTMP